MKKQQNLEMDSVTYSFVDGTKQVQPINKEAFFADHRGRKRSRYDIVAILEQNGLDRGATSYTIDADTDNVTNDIDLGQSFTAKERYNAKRDFIEFKKGNPQDFHKERVQLINRLSDGLSKRLRFNLVNLAFLK